MEHVKDDKRPGTVKHAAAIKLLNQHGLAVLRANTRQYPKEAKWKRLLDEVRQSILVLENDKGA